MPIKKYVEELETISKYILSTLNRVDELLRRFLNAESEDERKQIDFYFESLQKNLDKAKRLESTILNFYGGSLPQEENEIGKIFHLLGEYRKKKDEEYRLYLSYLQQYNK